MVCDKWRLGGRVSAPESESGRELASAAAAHIDIRCLTSVSPSIAARRALVYARLRGGSRYGLSVGALWVPVYGGRIVGGSGTRHINAFHPFVWKGMNWGGFRGRGISLRKLERKQM